MLSTCSDKGVFCQRSDGEILYKYCTNTVVSTGGGRTKEARRKWPLVSSESSVAAVAQNQTCGVRHFLPRSMPHTARIDVLSIISALSKGLVRDAVGVRGP